MKKLALGIATAAVLATAAASPAMAQVGFYAGPGGVGIDLGATSPYYRDDCGYYGCGGGYYDYYGGPNVLIGGGWGDAWHGDWHGNHAHVHGPHR
jgi:hypothetical protein